MSKQKIIYRDEHVALVRPIPSGIPYWNFWDRKDKPDFVIVVAEGNRIVGVYHKVPFVTNIVFAERFFPSRYWDVYERIPQD